MQQEDIQALFRILQKSNPHPVPELQFNTPFELLIAVMLSAQATDISVNKVTTTLFPLANTPQKILELGEKQLKQHIKSIGLYNSKASHILATCKILLEKYHGKIPQTREALERLPGVGRKTANVILNTVFHQSTIAVDTHVFRVANRTGLAPGKTPLDVEKKLLSVIPEKFKKDAHHWLLLHGRYTCTARHPKCTQCPISAYCKT